jgi:hypothetical protein
MEIKILICILQLEARMTVGIAVPTLALERGEQLVSFTLRF